MPPLAFAEQPLRALLQKHAPNRDFTLEPMPGGASLRRFFRVRFTDERDATSGDLPGAVAMFFPDPETPEEVSAETGTPPREWPFLEVRALLEARGIAVPRLIGSDCAAGWLLVEDLGDVTLAERLRVAPEQKPQLYQQAVRDLARAQLALADLPEASIVRARRFDSSLLLWEIEHFREFGLEARGITPSGEQAQCFIRCASEIADAIAALPLGFVHRDYQSRNLMLHPRDVGAEQLFWIDFQDALLGPCAYDLVALLGDSYQSFDDAFVEERLADFAEARGLGHAALRQLRREFDLITVQRKLKDAGRFVFIQHKKGDSSYLRFIEPSLRLVQRAMQRLDDLEPVRTLHGLLRELDVWPRP